jgi:hypothetical protein
MNKNISSQSKVRRKGRQSRCRIEYLNISDKMNKTKTKCVRHYYRKYQFGFENSQKIATKERQRNNE